MFWQRISSALLAGTCVALTALPARAGDCCAPAPCAPVYKTVCCVEWVPEKYTAERTCYKTEWKEEKYTCFKCECVQEQRTCTKTIYEKVAEVKEVTRIVCERVPVCEEKTIMTTHVTCKPVVKTVKKCVDKGHWECKLVEVKPSCLHKLFHHNDCECECPKYKEKKCWVPCPVWIETQVTCYEKVCEQRPITVKCTTYKTVQREEKVQVTCYKCVPKQVTETYTVNVMKKVPFEATRKVGVCVPYTEKVECTRMVKKVTTKQVECAPVCETSCKKHSFFHKSCCD
jgi:hypothetical protein